MYILYSAYKCLNQRISALAPSKCSLFLFSPSEQELTEKMLQSKCEADVTTCFTLIVFL